MARNDFSPFLHAQNLPAELQKELNIKDSDDSLILDVFQKGGGILNISEVLVGLYKTHGQIKTRQHMTTQLYKLCRLGLLKKTGKKGEYTTDVFT